MTNAYSDLIQQLSRQLKFLQTSCDAYDRGELEEALRISVALRVLFHDTNKSTSLLTHLGKKDSINLISTFGLDQTDEQLGGGFVMYIPLMVTMDGVKPILGDCKSPKTVPCEPWWNEIVMAQSHRFSRRDVVLSSANQDGGAHVDISPNNKTIELKEGIGTLTKVVDGVDVTEVLSDHHFPMLRQIGYEVLNSPEITSLV